MYLYQKIQKIFLDFIPKGMDPSLVLPPIPSSQGDFSSSLAFSIAKFCKKNAQDVAKSIASQIKNPLISHAIPLNGYVNIFLQAQIWQETIVHILSQGIFFGSHTFGNQRLVNMEYLSANPTGPLHAAHSRGAIIGDVVANLLSFVGSTDGNDVLFELFADQID